MYAQVGLTIRTGLIMKNRKCKYKNFACPVKNIQLLFFTLFTTKRILPEEMTEERVPWERFVEKEGFKLGKKE